MEKLTHLIAQIMIKHIFPAINLPTIISIDYSFHEDNLSDHISIRLHHNLHCIVLNQKSLFFQSKRKGASHISMTHTLLCIHSFLILFQKILRKAFFKHALIPWC